MIMIEQIVGGHLVDHLLNIISILKMQIVVYLKLIHMIQY